MSQEQIDAFFKYLEEHPRERPKAARMKPEQLAALAAQKGFHFTAEELAARQALVFLENGT